MKSITLIWLLLLTAAIGVLAFNDFVEPLRPKTSDPAPGGTRLTEGQAQVIIELERQRTDLIKKIDSFDRSSLDYRRTNANQRLRMETELDRLDERIAEVSRRTGNPRPGSGRD